MQFIIRHQTKYHYSRPIQLAPQQLRFFPRGDGAQRVIEHQLTITPAPLGRNDHLDLEGNQVSQVWFNEKTDSFEVDVNMRVETLRNNAYDFILTPEAAVLPIDHGHGNFFAKAYLEPFAADDAVTAFANELNLVAKRDPLRFLNALNQQLFADFAHIYRETGEPQLPAHTLAIRRGACRDLTVLFVDCCRSQGLAARFASGYHNGGLFKEQRHLHAWAEVYLPGAGWRGFDPTHGIVIADTHVTIAASAVPGNTMPVTGGFFGDEVVSTLYYTLAIQVIGD